jgi:hypothetical protein
MDPESFDEKLTATTPIPLPPPRKKTD